MHNNFWEEDEMHACMHVLWLSGLLTRSDLLFVVLLEEDIVVELGEAVVFETTPSSPLPSPSVSHFFDELIFFSEIGREVTFSQNWQR